MGKVQSLSGNGKEYVELQGRIMNVGWIHVQGRGSFVNRPYGVADNVKLKDEDTADVLKLLTRDRKSLAHTGKGYFPMQARLRKKDNVVVIQVPAKTFNKPWGIQVEVPAAEVPALAEFLTR